MQTLLLRMLDNAQRQTDLLLEQRSLCMEFLDHIDKMDQEHQRFYQTQRSTQIAVIPQPVPEPSPPPDPGEAAPAEVFHIPSSLRNGPIRGDR